VVRRKSKKKYDRILHYHYDKKKKKTYLVDTYGEPWFAQGKEDRTRNVGISLPSSLLKKIDEKRGPVDRSRYLRNLIEDAMNVERVS
jgi:hypothetical protein